jgi:putative aldouronate transport system substrate-binding protein
MKRALLKRLVLVLGVTVFASNLAACAQKNKETDKSTNQSTQAEVVKPTVINGMFDTILKVEDGQEKVAEEYKKQTGIELKINNPVHNQYYEKVNLAFASGDVPDVIEIGGSTYVTYATNGALYDMTSLVEKSTVLNKIPKMYIDSEKIGGKLYGMPKASGNGTVTYLRKDWMEANNLQIPTNYNEFINVLKVFSDDPDKNGKKDTVGITEAGLFSDDPTTTVDIYLREFYQDAYPDFKQVNGKWVDGMLQPEMKAALQRLKDAYSMGLMDKEIITNKTTDARNKFYAGKAGAFNYWAGQWNVTLDNELKKNFPNASVVAIPAIKETQYSSRVPSVYAITSKAKNPEGVFKYLIEYMHDGGKGEMLFSRGVENVHWKSTGDGKAEMLPSLSNEKTIFAASYFEPTLTITEFKDPVNIDPRIKNSQKILAQNVKMAFLVPPSEAYAKNSVDIIQARKQIISKVVIGQITIDAGLEQYKKENQASIDAILKEFNGNK